MVKDSRASIRTDRLRPLATPRRAHVEADAGGLPHAVRFEGAMHGVASVQDCWRIDDEWWRERAVSRMYWQVRLESGRLLTLYHDLIGETWWEQRY